MADYRETLITFLLICRGSVPSMTSDRVSSDSFSVFSGLVKLSFLGHYLCISTLLLIERWSYDVKPSHMCVYPERCLTYPWKKNLNLKKCRKSKRERKEKKKVKRKKLKEKNKVGAARARTSYLKIREE